MPETRNRPGSETGAAQEIDEDTRSVTIVADTADYIADLDRRRAAAQRLAILDTGHADPLDELGAELPAGEVDYSCQRQFVTDPVTVVRLSCARGCRDTCHRERRVA